MTCDKKRKKNKKKLCLVILHRESISKPRTETSTLELNNTKETIDADNTIGGIRGYCETVTGCQPRTGKLYCVRGSETILMLNNSARLEAGETYIFVPGIYILCCVFCGLFALEPHCVGPIYYTQMLSLFSVFSLSNYGMYVFRRYQPWRLLVSVDVYLLTWL